MGVDPRLRCAAAGSRTRQERAAGRHARSPGGRPEDRVPYLARPARRAGRDLPARRAGQPRRDFAVSAGSGSATPNMARVYDYWLGGKDTTPPAGPRPSDCWRSTRRCGIWSGRTEWTAGPGHHLGSMAGNRPVHRPGRGAACFSGRPPDCSGGPPLDPGRLHRH